MKNQMKILTRHLLIRRDFREKCIFTNYNERVFVFDLIYFVSSNLKLSIDICIRSVCHVFTDFRFIFVKCSCSRRDGTSLFSLFYKIILYIQGSRLDHFLRVCEWKIDVVALVLVHGLRCSKACVLPAAAHCSRRKISLTRHERFSFHTHA